jgi:hypothetical protein
MATVTIQPPEALLAQMREQLKPGQFRQAIWQAVKRTTEKGAKQVQAAIAEQTTIRKDKAKDGIKTVLTRGDSPIGTITIRRRPLPASYFKTRASKRRGASVQFTRNGPVVSLGHAFKATVTTAGIAGEHGGHIGIFTRAKRLPSKGPNVKRAKMVQSGEYAGKIAAQFTLKEIFGPPLIDLVNGTEIAAQVTKDAGTEMSKQLQSQINRFMKVRANG